MQKFSFFFNFFFCYAWWFFRVLNLYFGTLYCEISSNIAKNLLRKWWKIFQLLLFYYIKWLLLEPKMLIVQWAILAQKSTQKNLYLQMRYKIDHCTTSPQNHLMSNSFFVEIITLIFIIYSLSYQQQRQPNIVIWWNCLWKTANHSFLLELRELENQPMSKICF